MFSKMLEVSGDMKVAFCRTRGNFDWFSGSNDDSLDEQRGKCTTRVPAKGDFSRPLRNDCDGLGEMHNPILQWKIGNTSFFKYKKKTIQKSQKAPR